MKITIKTQIRVIEAKTGYQFQEDFNRTANELANQGIKYRVELNNAIGMHCAYFFFDEEVKVAETIAEECRLAGIDYNCINCPDYNLPEDRRKSESYCSQIHGFIKSDSRCCDSFYIRLLNNEIEPQTIDIKYRER